MATFLSTTLTKRTGSTTTVFSPGNIGPDGTGYLSAGSTYSGLSPRLDLKSWRSAQGRNAKCRLTIPQLSPVDTTTVLYRPYGQVELYIPDGTLQTDVNDLVGYLNALTASGLTNLNAILVNGEGVY